MFRLFASHMYMKLICQCHLTIQNRILLDLCTVKSPIKPRPSCGYYSRAAYIRYWIQSRFHAEEVGKRCGHYSRAAFIGDFYSRAAFIGDFTVCTSRQNTKIHFDVC